MEKSLSGVKFKDNNIKNKKIEKEYFLKKINLKNYPKLKKNLEIFFNDSKKYFDTSYENKYIIVGKKNNIKNNKKLTTVLTESMNNKNKSKNFKLLRRMSLIKGSVLRASNDSSNKSNSKNSKNSKNITEEKRKAFTNVEENALKPGQRFIDDKEVDKIFNLFKEVRRINNNKINNFVTLNELNETKSKNNFKFRKIINRNIINLKKSVSKKIINSVDKKNKKDFKKNNNFLLNKDHELDLENNLVNEIDFYKTISTGFTGIFKDELSNSNIMNVDNNDNNNKIKNNNTKKIKERLKLIEKQNQYIENELDKVVRDKLSNILAFQERTFMIHNKYKNFQSKLNKYLSSKIRRPKNKNLLLQENFRPNLEVKFRLNNFQKKLHADGIYDWYKDLHSSDKFLIIDERLPTVERIRNPNTIKFFSPIKNKILEDNEYLKKIIPKKALRNFSKDYRNIQNNYDSLSINGVNLLEFENNIFKKLKGRKIINDFERLMSPSSIKCKNIYSNIDKNIFTQKTKSYFKLHD